MPNSYHKNDFRGGVNFEVTEVGRGEGGGLKKILTIEGHKKIALFCLIWAVLTTTSF